MRLKRSLVSLSLALGLALAAGASSAAQGLPPCQRQSRSRDCCASA